MEQKEDIDIKKIFWALNNYRDLYLVSQTRVFLNKHNLKYKIDSFDFNTEVNSHTSYEFEEFMGRNYSSMYYRNLLHVLKNNSDGIKLNTNIKYKNEHLDFIINYFQNLPKYDLYCFSIYINFIDDYLIAALTIKNKFPDANILFGGPEIILDPPIRELISDLGIKYSIGDVESSCYKALTTTNIDCTSYIDLKLLEKSDVPTYSKKELEYTNYMISLSTFRGCPNNCYFCCSPALSPYRSIDRNIIISWMEYYNIIGVKEIQITDSNFNRFGFSELLDGLIKINNKCRIIKCNMELNSLTKDDIRKLKAANILSLSFGLECNSIELQKSINKKMPSREKIFEHLELLKEEGINVQIFYIFGLPTQTFEIFNDELKFLMEINKRFNKVETEIYDFIVAQKSYIAKNPNKFKMTYDNFGKLAKKIFPKYEYIFEKIKMNYVYPGIENMIEYKNLLDKNLLDKNLIREGNLYKEYDINYPYIPYRIIN